MIDRKKKLRLTQLFLLVLGALIIFFTYVSKETDDREDLISKSVKEKVEKQSEELLNAENDMFFNIEYTGLDLNGNRYILKSEEAILDKLKPEIVYMNFVNATFYFKDDTELEVWSDKGIYNNKTFDMQFKENVRANYLSSKLFAEKADFSNTGNFLSIYENVRINDIRGNLIADKLLFDITKQKLAITSFNDGRINANVKLDEKRF